MITLFDNFVMAVKVNIINVVGIINFIVFCDMIDLVKIINDNFWYIWSRCKYYIKW